MKRWNHTGKLGAGSGDATTVMVDLAAVKDVVNGPEDLLEWDAIVWRRQEEQVRRLRQRIFTATQAGDLKRVRNLQKLMLRSRANTLVSVRRVTRAQQQRVRNALEPEWEARLDPKQYGFRPGRGCHDAIEMIYGAIAVKNAKREWVLDADLKSAFDKIDHNFLLERIGTFPAKEQIRGWLKAGVVDKGRYSPTDEGTPQGGVISPLLLNIALQGMEAVAGVRYEYRGDRGYVKAGCPTVVTYADDFVVLCHTREQAETVRDRLSAWLKERGLSLHQEKTRIGRIDAGFDFLSFNIRRYHTGSGSKALTKPSREALSKIRRRNALELRALRGSSPAEVIMTMNPIIKGQANYYRSGASKKAYQKLDDHLWQCIYKWARRRHPRKPWKWISARYFGAFNPSRRNRWVFGDRDSGAYLHQYAWTKIVRHAPVPGRYSPDDPALARYWADRRRKRKPPQLAESWERHLRTQQGLCPLCRELLLYADRPPESPKQWEAWYRGIRKAIAHKAVTEHGNNRTTYRLVHVHCAQRQYSEQAHDSDQ